MPELVWREHRLDLTVPGVVGILNRTPDSFSDGGHNATLETAVASCQAMVEAGAVCIDVGGESSRPGALPVSEEDELARVVPLVEAIAPRMCVSIDTTKAMVALRCLEAGAAAVNDISALHWDPEMASVVADHDAGLVLMHMQGAPRTMQARPSYGDVVEEVYAFLAQGLEDALDAGVKEERIALDPGFGFGKTTAHNLALLHGLPRLATLGRPLYVGLSRKSLLGRLTGRAVDERLPATCAVHSLAVWMGADLLRVHDVGPAVDAVKVAVALRGSLAAPLG